MVLSRGDRCLLLFVFVGCKVLLVMCCCLLRVVCCCLSCVDCRLLFALCCVVGVC